MWNRWLVLGVWLLAAAPGNANAGGLEIGSPAPGLAVKGYVKGQPLRALEKGKVHVVEFWATWCAPCVQSIPHLSALQKKYPQINVLGVSIWEDNPSDVKPFVAKMGEKMSYRVALDQVPAGADSHQGKMSLTWMKAANQSGVPTAFIVNGSGVIAWIGHPMEMEEPLAKIVAGKWDVKAAAARIRREAQREKTLEALKGKVEAAQNDPKRLLAILNEAIQKDPGLEPILGVGKLRTLLNSSYSPSALAYARRLVTSTYKNDPEMLTRVARVLVDPSRKQIGAAEAALALEAALKADGIQQQKEPLTADTLARAHFVSGDARKAVAAQERVLRLVKGTKLEKDPGLLSRLAQYRKAVR